MDVKTGIVLAITASVLLALVAGLNYIKAVYGMGWLALACGGIIALCFAVAYWLESRGIR